MPLEVRLRAVKLYLEEGLPSRLICQELGVHPTVLHAWLKKYREGGEAGLKPRRQKRSAPTPASERLRQKIAEVKRKQPTFGVIDWIKNEALDIIRRDGLSGANAYDTPQN